ncbi:glycerophosphoryl diester phosphodiesterase membrane domain-containing protein [Streptomyces sp. NPDC059477]|uniref:glycerophosphoryl diester phosphodiesterase membrane domain-containing protein n=1 Tax=Streptomyces sp. NPDC059477 TaxID=3346847 RepID=UPI0036D12D9A
MNDTPGWASPGSAPSDGRAPGASGPAEPSDRPGPAQPAAQPDADPQSPGPKWSKEQPPPAQWSAPTGPQQPGQATPPPPPGPGWGTPPPGPAHGGWRGAPGGPGAPGPGPGGYAPYGGPGGPGGWGTPWGGPPPAAKPGIIPLRPLGVGEILDGAVSTMRTYWRTVLGISLTVAVITEIIVVLVRGFLLNDLLDTSALDNPDATLGELARVTGEAMAANFVIFVISLIGTITATALLATVTSRAVLGKSVTTAEAWRDARPQVLRLFGLIGLLLLILVGIVALGAVPSILVAAAGGGGAAVAFSTLLIIGAAVVALWMMVRLSLAPPALVLEKQSITKAMTRSAKLVRGSWWRIFGIQLLALIIAYVIAMIVVVPFVLIGATVDGGGISAFIESGTGLGWTFLVISGIGSVIGSMITLPITAGVLVLLYIDQRIRREALDLDLARAAGVQGYAATPRS